MKTPADPETTAPTPPRRRFRLLRGVLKLVGWTIVVVVSIVLLVLLFLQTGPGKSLVKDIVADTLNGSFRGRVELDELGGFLPFDVELVGFRAYDPEGAQVMSVGSVTAKFHPLELFDNTVHLSEVRVTKPEVEIFDQAGQLALLRAFAPREPSTDDTPSPWTVRFEGDLAEGHVGGLIAGEDLALNDLSVDLSLGFGPKGLRWPHLELSAIPTGTSKLVGMFARAGPEPGRITVTTAGELTDETLELSSLRLEAGEHSVAMVGTLGLGDALTAELDISDLRVVVARLPEQLRAHLFDPDPALAEPAVVTGSGHITLADNGEAAVDLALRSPFGNAGLQVGASVREAGDPAWRLGAWSALVDVVDLTAPPRLRRRMPEGARAARADLHLEASGSGLPLDPGAAVRLELAIEEHAPHSGRLGLTITRIADAPGDAAPTFDVEADSLTLDLQPWLGWAGEPDLIGQIKALHAEGAIAMPDGAPPRLTLRADFDATASGTVRALGESPLSAPAISGHADVQWSGAGLPSGRVELAGVELGFDVGRVRVFDIDLDLRAGTDGTPELVGTLKVNGARWDQLRVETLELPLDLVLENLANGDPLPTGRVRWRATGIDLGAQRIASSTGDVHVGEERGGLRVRGISRTGRFDLGRALGVGAKSSDLELDAWLAAGPDGAPAGGPITARLAGSLEGARHGPRIASRLSFDDLLIELPRGPSGPLLVQGVTRWGVVSAPEASFDSATIGVDLTVDPRAPTPSGTAQLDVRGLSVAGGKRFDHVVVDAEALPDGTIRYQGSVQKRVTSEDEDRGDRGVTARLSGRASLPSGRRALSVVVDELRLRRPGDLTDFVVAKHVHYGADGWLSLDSLVVRAGRTAGALEIDGARFNPADGSLDGEIRALDLSIPTWFALAGEALGWADLPPLEGIPSELGGDLTLTLDLDGSLSAPRLKADLAVEHLRWGERAGASLKARLATTESGLDLLAALRWHEGGDLSLDAELPAVVSLSPPQLTWDDQAPARLAASFDETELKELLAWADALSGTGVPSGAELREAAGVEELAGAVRFDVLIDGTPADPRMRVNLTGHPLDIGRWKAGSLVLEGSAQGDATMFRLLMADASDRTQAQVDVELPFGIARALRKSDPIGWMRDEIRQDEFAVDLNLPRFKVAETPLTSFMPESVEDLEVEVDLTFGGTLEHPIVDGVAELLPAEDNPFGLGFVMGFATHDDIVDVRLTAAQLTGDALVDGSLSVPRLGDVLESPSVAVELLEDPTFALSIQSPDIASFDLWELNQAAGDLAVQLFPDGRVMFDVSAHGSPVGLQASVMTRIRTVVPDGEVPPSQRDFTAVRRNAADDVRLAVLVGRDRTSLALTMLQDARSVTPFLAIQALAKIGPGQLMSPPDGKPVAIGDVPILARISAGDFRLEGFASAFRDVLGTSGGQLTGEVLINGTILRPRFRQSLVAQFQPIVVAPLGLSHDWATVNIDFENGTDWRVTISELYDETRRTNLEPVSRCGVQPLVTDSVDYSVHPYLAIRLSGSIPSLDPKVMTLGGCIGMRDYPLLAKSDMHGRIDGALELGGTVARPAVRGELTTVEAVIAPNMASKTIRPLGTPLDVTMVRGAPVPPPVRPKRYPYRTNVALDIKVNIPEDSVRLEPSFTQPFGEVRALLYPSGSLRIRTAAGELGLVGTIDVPKESILLYAKRFTVDSDSRVVFTGDMTSDPQIFFTARHNIAHVDLSSIGLTTTEDSEVVVRVTGSPNALRPKFTSTPSMDETNILSVIAIGVPAGGGAVGEALQAQLFTAIMGMATLQFTRDFKQRLALDVLRIEARSADPSEQRLTVGKRLADNLILSYYFDLAADEDEDVNSGSLEYRLTRYLSILARGGDAGDLGLELNLRFQH